MVMCHSLQLSCTSEDECQRLDGQHGEDRGRGKFITFCKFSPNPFLPPLPISSLASSLLSPVQDWMSSNPPECDVKGKYYTPVGINLFQIVEQNVNTFP